MIVDPPLSELASGVQLNFAVLALATTAEIERTAFGTDWATKTAAVEATESSPKLFRAITVKL